MTDTGNFHYMARYADTLSARDFWFRHADKIENPDKYAPVIEEVSAPARKRAPRKKAAAAAAPAMFIVPDAAAN